MATATATAIPSPAAPAKAAAAPKVNAPAAPRAPGVLDFKGAKDFKPGGDLALFLDSQKESSLDVRFGRFAHGPITVQTLKPGQYRIKKQPVPLSHPLFARAAEALPDLAPCLVLNSEDGNLSGAIGLAAGATVERLESHLTTTPEMLGLTGFRVNALPALINKLEDGNLHLGLADVPFRLGSAFAGTFTLDTVDENITFSGSAAITVKGLANGTLDLKRAPDGTVTGNATVGLTMPKNITGSFNIAWDGRAVTGEAKAGYQGEKLSGEVTLHLMERSQAEALEAAAKAPENTPPAAASAAPAAPPKNPSARVDYVVFGDGTLSFAFNEWLHGNAQVIINPRGYLTVIGKITPQKEFTLFEQRDYIKPIFKVESRYAYGIPVVGNVFIFVGLAMDVFAKLGPGTFTNIEVEGTYSTDPAKANDFTIKGTFNVSAAAGARLRAEAGAGLEILDHDIKIGAGINGIAGIKAYAEAIPIIGYREKVTNGEDKKGEFFIRGEMEIAAQAFLGLSGDVFVAIETPWWSPLSDHRWTWPLFSKEWPLGDGVGIGATIDYVFGSGQLPTLDFKPVDFSADKFTTSLYEDKLPSGGAKEGESKGKWKEKNSAADQPPPKVSKKGNGAPGKLPPAPAAKAKPPGSKKKGKAATDDALTADGKKVGDLKKKKAKQGKQDPKAKDAKGKDDKTKNAGPPPKLPDVDVPAKFGKESHTLRAHQAGGRIVFQMASGAFSGMSEKVAKMAQTYKTLFGSKDPKAAAEVEKKFQDLIAKTVLREKEVNQKKNAVTKNANAGEYMKSASSETAMEKGALDELKKDLDALGHEMTGGALGAELFAEASHLKPGDAVVYMLKPPRAIVVTKTGLIKEIKGQYELVFEAKLPNTISPLPMLYRERDIVWQITTKTLGVPYVHDTVYPAPALALLGMPTVTAQGGKVTVDDTILGTGTGNTKDYDPPHINKTNGSKLYNQRGHLVARVLGGPVSQENIVALTHDANVEMRLKVEEKVRDIVKAGAVVYYEVKAYYPGSDYTKPVQAVEIKAIKKYPVKSGDEDLFKLSVLNI